jgi:hypothetical protein
MFFLLDNARDGSNLDKTTFSQNTSPPTHRRHLTKVVGGKQHRCPSRSGLPDQIQDDLTHQRIQTACRLVQHQEFGLVLEGVDDTDLLSVSFGEVAHGALQVELESAGKSQAPLRRIRPTSQCAENAERSFGTMAAPDSELAG